MSEETVVAGTSGDDHVLFYCPFESEHPEAKLVIVGITPGPAQLMATYQAAPKLFARGLSDQEVLAELKRFGGFGGELREPLCQMLDHFGIPKRMGLGAAHELWTSGWSQFYSTSVVPNAAFHRKKFDRKGHPKLFSGTFQEVLASSVLRSDFERTFLGALGRLNSQARFVALGPTPRDALDYAVDRRVIRKQQVLGSFAHPSPAARPQVDVYLQKIRREDLHPKSPVVNRVDPLNRAYAEMVRNVDAWA